MLDDNLITATMYAAGHSGRIALSGPIGNVARRTTIFALVTAYVFIGLNVCKAANFAGKLTSDELAMLQSGRLRKRTG